MVTKSSLRRRIFNSIFVPPITVLPIGVLLFLFGVDVSIIKDVWYLSIFVSCIILALRDKMPLSEIGLSRQKMGLSLLLATVWELVTFFFLGVIPFYAVTGKLPILVSVNTTMITSALHFMLVSTAEETWARGLLLRILREWRPKGLAAVIWSSIIFLLLHVPATLFVVFQDASLIPLLALSWLTLFVWAAGLAVITIKTGNLMGPIIIHWLDDFVSEVLFPLQI